jgi:glucokinase
MIVNGIKENAVSLLEKVDSGIDEILCVGVGIPGLVGIDGKIIATANVNLSGVNLKNMLECELGTPAFLAKDSHLAAYAEYFCGCGEGNGNLAMITLGTGLGLGIVWDKRLLQSTRCGIGELGHICINPEESERCNCGRYGCLEQYASATGLVRIATRHLSENTVASVLRSGSITSKDIFDAYEAGDEIAILSVNEFIDYLARGLGTLMMILDPDVIVIGGGVSKAGDRLLNLLKPKFTEHGGDMAKYVELKLASLGNDAGICGAARYAKNSLSE